MTPPAVSHLRPAVTDRRGWLEWLRAEFPGVGFVCADQWIAVVGWRSRWSAPTPYELEYLLRSEFRYQRVPRLPDILPARRARAQ